MIYSLKGVNRFPVYLVAKNKECYVEGAAALTRTSVVFFESGLRLSAKAFSQAS